MDVFSIPVQPKTKAGSVEPTPITHEALYVLWSLDIAADEGVPVGTKILISTNGHPIGSLLEEFTVGSVGRHGIYQPHVLGEPSGGPQYGPARFIHGGMDILFLAATNKFGGDFDYNVYSMDEVTGGDIKQLTHLRGMTTGLNILPSGKAVLLNGGVTYLLDIGTQKLAPL